MLYTEFKTIEEYNQANQQAHKILTKVKGYNSPMYASEQPIISVKGTYLLPITEKLKKHLPFEGREVEKSYIKARILDEININS
jgi:hypothetical protein